MGKRIVVVASIVTALAATTVGFALAQTGQGSTRPSGEVIHVVILADEGHVQLFDFNQDGLTLGDRLAAVGPLRNEDLSQRVGTYYLDCYVGSVSLKEGSPYVCTEVLKLRGGNITTQGLDPHGTSDVFFAVTGGSGTYEEAAGQAEYIDTTQTDIIIHLDDE
jgi:hypothetical protein